MRHRAEYWLVRFLLFTLTVGPRSLSPKLARLYTRALDLLVPKLRRTAYRNLTAALPNQDPDPIVTGAFCSIARILVSLARFPSLSESNIQDWISYEGYEHFDSALERGRGVLFATAHLGNWELSAFAHALMSAPMGVVVRPLDNPLVDALVEHQRSLSGNTPLGKKESARSIIRMLTQNRAVGVLIDQNVQMQEGIFINFFGIPAAAGASFAKLAYRTGAAVIPGYALWIEQSQRYVLRFYPEIPMTGDTEADTAALHAHLESVIREYPDQWMWFHRRWKTRPPGEPSFY